MESKLFTFFSDAYGYIRNAALKDGELRLFDGGIWISRAIDSGETGTVWDKAEISSVPLENGFFRFTALARDEDNISVGNESYPAETALAAAVKGAPMLIEGLAAVSYVNPRTAPLHTLKGRFLWFLLEGFPEKGGYVGVSRVNVYCPHISFMSALPEVFARNDDGNLTSLLALYKEVFDRLDREITDFGRRLCPDTASGEDLARLVSWQGIKLSDIWGEDKLRRVVKSSARLIRLKGTCAALSELFEILLGKAPEITENSADFSFTVTIEHGSVPSGRHHAELLSLLRDFTPVGITSRLVLKNEARGGGLDNGTSLTDDAFGSGFII